MSKEFIPEFNKLTPAVREPLINSYGFDLTDENFIKFKTGSIQFAIIGFKATTQYDTLITTLKVCLNPHVNDQYVHSQRIDLYNLDRIESYARTAAQQLKCTVDEIKKGVYTLRERLERYRFDELKGGGGKEQKKAITAAEQKEAIDILKADNLLECIEGLLKQAGLVTETENGLRLFMILLSRHFDKPLHVLFQGSTQLSKMVMDTLTSTIPTNEIHQQTSMSPNSLYYTKRKEYWKNKVLAVGKIDKQFKAAHTLQEFIENQILKRYTTESDYLTRQLNANTKTVEGNICLLGYSEDENMNNKFFQDCFFIRLEENETNTKELLYHQKMEAAGLISHQELETARQTLMNLQSLLKPKKVVIPYAMVLNIPEHVFQPLRSFNQLLTFIKTVALLHQHQLKTKRDENGEEYIEATTEHLQIAMELFKSILLTQSDVLSPSQRFFLERLKNEVKEKDTTFKIPELMTALKMKRTSFYREFNVLKELKYIIQSGGNKKGGIEYKIVNWEDYNQIEQSTNNWEEQLKTIKMEVSQKNPRSFPKSKKEVKPNEQSFLSEVSQNPN